MTMVSPTGSLKPETRRFYGRWGTNAKFKGLNSTVCIPPRAIFSFLPSFFIDDLCGWSNIFRNWFSTVSYSNILDRSSIILKICIHWTTGYSIWPFLLHKRVVCYLTNQDAQDFVDNSGVISQIYINPYAQNLAEWSVKKGGSAMETKALCLCLKFG